MAQVGLFGVPMSSDSIRDLRGTPGSICTGIWGGGTVNPSERGRPRICPRRLGGRMQDWNLPRSPEVSRTPGEGRRCHHIVSLHSMGRRGGPAKGATGYQLIETIATMEARRGADGDVSRIRYEHPERRSLCVHGHLEGIQAPTAPSGDEELVHFQVRHALLPVCSASVWLGKISTVVHAAYVSVCERATSLGVSCASVSGRLSGGTVSVRNYLWAPRVYGSAKPNYGSYDRTGTTATPRKGRVDGSDTGGAP